MHEQGLVLRLKNYYVFQHGTLDVDDECLRFKGLEDRKIPKEQIDGLHLLAGFTLTSGLLEMAAASEFPIHVYGYYGSYRGSFVPKNAPESAERLLAQLRSHDNPQSRLQIGKNILQASLRSDNHLLLSIGSPQLDAQVIEGAPTVELLRLEEARLRKEYYALLDTKLQDYYMILSRTRRPPTNPANCLLGYWNGLTYAQTISSLYRAGIDPRIGYIHGDMRAPNPLALDLAELFKPYLSETLLVKVAKEAPKTAWFTEVGEGTYLNDHGKKEAAKLFDRQLSAQVKHAGLKRYMEFREAMIAEGYRLEKKLLGVSDYEPMVVECTLSSPTICH